MAQQEESKVPDYLSPEWHDYVLSLFAREELDDGLPKVDGLRRVAQVLLGEIDYSGPTQVFPVVDDKTGRSTVMYEIVFANGKTYGDVADVWIGNTDNTYVSFSVATACTRAEGRCLRKALRLRSLCAEELPATKDSAKEVAKSNENAVTQDQVEFIDLKCRKLDIDVLLFINSGEKQYGSIYDVLKESAAKMIKVLGEYQKSKEVVPESIKGYKENWRSK